MICEVNLYKKKQDWNGCKYETDVNIYPQNHYEWDKVKKFLMCWID